MTFGFSDNERERLVKLSQGRSVVVEIGTGFGDSAQLILQTIPKDGHLFTIDPLDGRSGGSVIEETSSKDFFLTIQEKLRPYKDRYTLIVGLSKMVSRFFLDRSVDMVFLDGAHDYESVMTDILSWLPKIREGGIICGHDYECPSTQCDPSLLIKYSVLDYCAARHYGVIRAVDEIFEDVPHAELMWWSGVA